MRFLMLLALSLWLGAIFFFALMAPTVFSVLPTRELAGQLINPLLYKLHWVGAICGAIFLITSMISNWRRTGSVRLVSAPNLLIVAMLALLAISQFAIVPRMAELRQQMGVIDNIAQDDARRMSFNDLHHWSTRLEGSIFFLGLGVLYLTSRRLDVGRR